MICVGYFFINVLI